MNCLRDFFPFFQTWKLSYFQYNYNKIINLICVIISLVELLLWYHVTSDVALVDLLLWYHVRSGVAIVNLLQWYHVTPGWLNELGSLIT